METPSRRAPRASKARLEIAALIVASIYGALAEKILDVPDGHTAEKVADEALLAADVLINRAARGVQA